MNNKIKSTMKINLKYLLLLSLVVSCSNNETDKIQSSGEKTPIETVENKNCKKNDLEDENLQGKVSEISSSIKRINSNGLESLGPKGISKYNEYGYLSEYISLNSDNQIEEKEIYVFESIGKLVDEKTFSSKDNRMIGRSEYEYDKNGNNITYKWIMPDNSLGFMYKYKFNDKNLMILKEHYTGEIGSETMSFQETYTYNENCQLIETRNNSTYGGEYLMKFVYSVDGNLQDELYCASDGTVKSKTSYSYEMTDDHNNWLLKNKIANGKVTEIEQREIKYYQK
jgi:hypothetical protein